MVHRHFAEIKRKLFVHVRLISCLTVKDVPPTPFYPEKKTTESEDEPNLRLKLAVVVGKFSEITVYSISYSSGSNSGIV